MTLFCQILDIIYVILGAIICPTSKSQGWILRPKLPILYFLQNKWPTWGSCHLKTKDFCDKKKKIGGALRLRSRGASLTPIHVFLVPLLAFLLLQGQHSWDILFPTTAVSELVCLMTEWMRKMTRFGSIALAPAANQPDQAQVQWLDAAGGNNSTSEICALLPTRH